MKRDKTKLGKMDNPNRYGLATHTKIDGAEIIFEPVVDSDFRGVQYVIKDKHIGIFTEKDGVLVISFGMVEKFCKELMDVKETWESVRV